MQLLRRNMQTIYYKTYEGQTAITDASGYYTGEYTESYSDLKTLKAYVTASQGQASEEMFGANLDYDKVIITDDSTDIDEYTILWIDAPTTGEADYAVRKVAKSLNHANIAIKKVR